MNLILVKSQIIRNIFSFRFLFVIIIGYVLTYIELHSTNRWGEIIFYDSGRKMVSL